MYLKITQKKTNRGVGKYAKIVESYWDKTSNTSRQKVIMNLGAIKSDNDLKRYEKILESMKKGVVHVDFNKVEILNTKEYGVTYTTNKLLEKYEIKEILQKELSDNKAQFKVYEIIKALIINRLVKPSSDLSAYDWIKKDYAEKISINRQYIYRALDYLVQKKDKIEKDIYGSLKKIMKLNTEIAHYDLTSTYFDGSKCEIAFYGYSRDHRKDRKQVVIGLVMIDGIPVYHEVYNGNTVDKTTLKNMVNNMKEKFGIKDLIVVADRGLITGDNLDLLENKEYHYIIGVQRRNNNLAEELLSKEITSEEKQFAKEIHRETKIIEDKEIIRRYILCLDNQTRNERLENLEEIKDKKEKELKMLQDKYAKSMSSNKCKKMTKESLIISADKILGKNNRLFDFEYDETGLKYSFKAEDYEYEKKIAGKFLLVTNTEKSPKEAMKSYKELQTVENAFDECKNFLYVRPVYHWKGRRVRAHIFVCVLSFLIESIIEKFSKESARETVSELKRITLSEITAENNSRKVLTKLTDKQLSIFKESKISSPVIF
ncbi:MAG: IS1634 family transposase [Nanoarchaeota archaeon]